MTAAHHESPPALAPTPVRTPTVLVARSGWQAIHLSELWQYRDLLWILAARDIKVRYKQTVLGVAWAVLQPLITAAIFTVILSKMGHIPTDGLPAPLFYFCGNLIWQLYAGSLGRAGGSLIGNSALISKVYFPRLLIPLAAIIGGMVDFCVGFVILLVLMVWCHAHVTVTLGVLLFPVFVLLVLLASLGVGLWFAALNVRFRDVGFVLPFVIQVWMWVSPVPYSLSGVPERWRWLVILNPLSGPVEGFRWALLGHTTFPGMPLAISVGEILLLLLGALFFFKRTERAFADII